MAATPTIPISEGRVFTVFTSTAAEMRVSEGRVFAIYNFPSAQEDISGVRVFAPIKQNLDMEISEVRVFAIVKGRVENRKLRAGAFPLDGHDFYMLRLGDRSTLMCDLTTGQWMEWKSEDLGFWRPNCVWNWIDMNTQTLSDRAGSKIVMGDDTFGLLWTLDPDVGYDEPPRTDLPSPTPFNRVVTGGLPMRMRDTMKVGAAYLTADMGTPQLTGANITLRTSDDSGKTWNDHGTITVEPDNYDQEFVWRSLGLIKSPGRIFEITDNGASVRLDSLEIK